MFEKFYKFSVKDDLCDEDFWDTFSSELYIHRLQFCSKIILFFILDDFVKWSNLLLFYWLKDYA